MLKLVDRVLEWENAGSMKLVSTGYSLRPPELLFKKIEDEQVKAQVDKLHAGLKKPAAAAAPPLFLFFLVALDRPPPAALVGVGAPDGPSRAAKLLDMGVGACEAGVEAGVCES